MLPSWRRWGDVTNEGAQGIMKSVHPRTPGCNRRRFLQCALGGTGMFWLSGGPQVLGASRERQRLRVAVIGCGGAGTGCVGVAVQERLMALVDVDERKLAAAWRAATSFGHQPRVFRDYRKMLEACGNELEAVFIATPDHHHAPAAIRALSLGKPVFVEKPLAFTLGEARTLRLAGRRAMVPTQMGNQGHSQDGYRLLCEHIWAGAIGAVKEVHCLLERDPVPQAELTNARTPPPWLEWDLWLGPAASREYQPGLHPAGWRMHPDFGNGVLGDMGCHGLDGAFWALKLWQVETFTVECLAQTKAPAGCHATDNVICWRIPERKDFPAVSIYSYDTRWPAKIRALEQQLGEKLRGGTLYFGEKGMMFTGPNGEGPRFLPSSEHDAFRKPKQTIERPGKNIYQEFLEACRGKKPASSNFETAGPLTEFVLTGALASRLGVGQRITWDSSNLQAVGCPEAQALVRRTYRAGWEVEELSS